MRPSTAEELADELGLDLPRPLRMMAPPDCPSQAAYIAYFDPAIAVLQTLGALERAALLFLSAISLVALALTPFAAALALRLAED